MLERADLHVRFGDDIGVEDYGTLRRKAETKLGQMFSKRLR